jgi:hypothetical protein
MGAFWPAFLRSLKTHGMHGVELVISDAHARLKAAIEAVVLGATCRPTVAESRPPAAGRGLADLHVGADPRQARRVTWECRIKL